MRILFLSQLVPWPAPLIGGQLRTARLVEALASECAVTFVCTESPYHRVGPPDEAFSATLQSVTTVPGAVSGDPLWGSGRSMLRGLLPSPVPFSIDARVSESLERHLAGIPGSFSAIWAARPWTAEAARRARKEPVLVDIDDFESVLLRQSMERLGRYGRRLLHELEARRLSAYEAGLPGRFAGVAVTKEEDLSLLDARYRHRSFIVPNGVDIPTVVERAPIAGRLLFVGSFGHPPNLDGMTWFCEDVLPIIRRSRPDVTLDIAGRGPISADWNRIRATPGVTLVDSPLQLADLYARAAAVVAPIRMGHGTKLKTLEALAHRAPLVATTEAATGMPLVPNKHYLSAESPEQFAAQCVLALKEHADLAEMARAASSVIESFTWRKAGQQAFDALKQVAGH